MPEFFYYPFSVVTDILSDKTPHGIREYYPDRSVQCKIFVPTGTLLQWHPTIRRDKYGNSVFASPSWEHTVIFYHVHHIHNIHPDTIHTHSRAYHKAPNHLEPTGRQADGFFRNWIYTMQHHLSWKYLHNSKVSMFLPGMHIPTSPLSADRYPTKKMDLSSISTVLIWCKNPTHQAS